MTEFEAGTHVELFLQFTAEYLSAKDTQQIKINSIVFLPRVMIAVVQFMWASLGCLTSFYFW
jgi:hypothetical protein